MFMLIICIIFTLGFFAGGSYYYSEGDAISQKIMGFFFVLFGFFFMFMSFVFTLIL